jgi:hypothetical protein
MCAIGYSDFDFIKKMEDAKTEMDAKSKSKTRS